VEPPAALPAVPTVLTDKTHAARALAAADHGRLARARVRSGAADVARRGRVMSAAVTRGASLMGVTSATTARSRDVHVASTSFDARAASILAERDDRRSDPARTERAG
jgi:hypothetical protein